MRTRIYNVLILSMVEEENIYNGEVWIEGDTIQYVGPSNKSADIQWDKEIDGEGNLLMPGFVNAHTHSAMTFLRSYADDLKLHDWLHKMIFPAEAKLTPDAVYWFTRLAIMEYLSSGITAAFDMYFHIDEGMRAAKDMGFRYALCDSINDFGGTVEQMEKDYHRFNNDNSDLSSFELGFHGEYTTCEETLIKVAELAEKLKAPVSTHCSETIDEVIGCEERHGMSPVAYLDSLGLFNYGGTLFHCVHLREGDYEIIRKRGIKVVTNPSSNLKLASGIAPIARLIDENIPVAIGTDGAASNNCLDMFREMFLVTGLQKAICKDPAVVPAEAVLKMATVNGAKAIGCENCGILKEGYKADMILIDLQKPNMQPIRHIKKNIVYSGSKQNIKMTMVGGRVLYQNGQFLMDISENDMYARINALTNELLDDGNNY